MDLGFLAKDELDSDLGNVAFNLKENAFSKVIQSIWLESNLFRNDKVRKSFKF